MKTTAVNIGGIIFHIEENAVFTINEYLRRLEFGSLSQESNLEIQHKMSDYLLHKLGGEKHSLGLIDIQDLLERMPSIPASDGLGRNSGNQESRLRVAVVMLITLIGLSI